MVEGGGGMGVRREEGEGSGEGREREGGREGMKEQEQGVPLQKVEKT